MSAILITGAAQGLGRSLALALANTLNTPTDLVLLDKDQKALNLLYDELISLNSTQVEPALYPMDLSGAEPRHFQQLAQALHELGGVDSVWLNAAELPAFTPIAHFDEAQWLQLLQTNLTANFYLMKALLPVLNDNADLITILDQQTGQNPAYYGAYGVAKAGLAQLMTTVAAEHSDQNWHFYQAWLPAFQSNTRSRQFPSENPATLPHHEQIANELMAALQQTATPAWWVKLN
ncbi:SDR family NAD(P)-dependent oxidoreductase [Thiomicrospira sp. WB1]|uniref:SDR family NAD(P)-dependent oxidoreductase n=1 Tax=Thiomicrospira sp. WB1 TaxID=1685380 RepID=UPI000749732B|nr:SDR family NAD(P)-dependent oxidoreductase [Thiomicrospira sp. WB1]KUJ72050.1 short-chain dehydrogenase [Thiomicrospira sp. WB1]